MVDDTTSRWEPESDEEYEAARTELKRPFAAWATRGDAVFDPDAPDGLLHYKWGYVDGHLTRWTRRDLEEIYLELYPAKVMAEPDELDEVLAEAAMFVTFLSETGLAGEESERDAISWRARVREVPATTGSVHSSGEPAPAELTQAPSTGAERPGRAGQ